MDLDRDDMGWIGVGLACVLVQLWLTAGGPLATIDAIGRYAFWPGLLHGGRPVFGWQPLTMFFTYGFLHTGWSHLVGNMVALGLFGRALAPRIGGAGWFLYFYALFLLGGAVGFALLSARPQPMVGASGAIMGLYGLWLVWDWRVTRRLGRVLGYVAAAIFADQALSWVTGGQVAWETHLGGLISGAIAGLWLPPFGGDAGAEGRNPGAGAAEE